ncbi:MAG: M67 family metallopeptidase [Chloroflexota bacterium]
MLNTIAPAAHLTIGRLDYEAMLAQLQAAYPLEACGLMGGVNGRVQRLYPVENIRQSPVEYEMDALQQVRSLLAIEAEGWQLVAIYHSHPAGPPTPSPTDLALAYYPDALQVIVSLQDRERPTARAFALDEGQVREVPIWIV